MGGVVVDLDHHAVGANGDGGTGQGFHHPELAGGVAGIHDDGQVAQALDGQHGGKVQGVAGVGFVGADAALAEDHIGVAASHDVLGAHEPLLDGGGKAALEQDGLLRLAQEAEQVEVLHVAGAYLDAVHLLIEDFDIIGAHDLGHNGQAGNGTGFLQQLQAIILQALEGVGGSAGFEGAAAQHGSAGLLDLLGHIGDLLLALYRAGTGHDGQLLAAHLGVAYFDDAFAGVEHAVGLLEGLGHLHNAFHAAEGFDLGRVHLAGIADEAQDGQIGTKHGVHIDALGHDDVCQLVDFLLGRTLLENDNHRSVSPSGKRKRGAVKGHPGMRRVIAAT